MAKLQIFVGEHCSGCEQLKEIAENGGFGDDVEVIDIETEEGFPKVAEMELTEIPSAYEDGQKCAIKYSNDNVEIKCPAENTLFEPDGESRGHLKSIYIIQPPGSNEVNPLQES